MDDNLYDEFGVYIGPDLDDDEVYSDEDEDRGENVLQDESINGANSRMELDETMIASRAVVLHEDKKYYPDAEEIYGDRVEVTVQEEDTQNISEPIVKPEDTRRFDYMEKEEYETKWQPTSCSKKFMEGLMIVPELIRHVAVVGHLHHGKTVLMDSLVQCTHTNKLQLSRNERFTDVRKDEQERGISIKSTPLSLVLPNHKGKSYLINFIDTPGHPNFIDEVTAAVRLADGVVFVIDAVEGLTTHAKSLLRLAALERLDIVVVINKIDRLILELKIPPADAYFKLKHILDELNEYLEAFPQLTQDCNDYENHENSDTGHENGDKDDQEHFKPRKISPELGNVIFAAGEHGFCFSLVQFAKIYCELNNMNAGSEYAFAKRLWGDIYFNKATRGFSTKLPSYASPGSVVRSFVQFILEPLYKIYGQVVGEDSKTLVATLNELGVHLTAEELKLDVRPLLKLVLIKFFGNPTGLVDMITQHVSNPIRAAPRKAEQIWTGKVESVFGSGILKCDPKGPLMIHTSKSFPNSDRTSFYVLGRVMSGTVKLGEKLKILGETFAENEEDMAIAHLTGLAIHNARYMVSFKTIGAGNWVLLEGVDETIIKTSTITTFTPIPMIATTDPHLETLAIFKPLKIPTLPVVKIAVEPLNPTDLTKLVEGLRKVNKTYPLLETRVEDSGERIILGSGEVYLDSVMHDLTKMFTDIEIKVAEPVVTFSETVIETSSLKCFTDTPNKANRITFIAEPLEKGLAEDIERGKLSLNLNAFTASTQPLLAPSGRNYIQSTYGWDIMSARNIWAFGPDAACGPNVLLNDTLPSEVPQASLNPVKDFIVRGFHWATSEGPLCEEPIRAVKFKMLHASISDEAPLRTGNQIIPTARRVAYSAFLTATPRLMEPIYAVDIWTPSNCIPAIDNVLSRRRGHIVSEKPLPGTPLYLIKAFIPCIDSFGFETDLRSHTHGQSFCLSAFDHWAVVPGNPLDTSIVIRPLEPSAPSQLARDFMLKTRRRKGLSEDISINKFFDEELLAHVQAANIDLLLG